MRMKYLLLFVVVCALVLVLMYIVREDGARELQKTNEDVQPPQNLVQVVEYGVYTLLPEESSVQWVAQKPLIVGYTHYGTMVPERGSLEVSENGTIGAVTLDMTRLRVDSLGGGKAGKETTLENHLKSGDFFQVDTYPTATFSLLRMDSGNDGSFFCVGELTIKNITNEVSFPATFTEDEGVFTLHANLTIDRTKWNITFGSASFFDNLAENAISNDVALSLNLVFKK